MINARREDQNDTSNAETNFDLSPLIELGNICFKLHELFGYKFIDGEKCTSSFIGQDIEVAYNSLNNNNMLEFNLRIAKLVFLCKQLDDIKQFKPELYKKYIRKLMTTSNEEQFFGSRFEIVVASKLSRNKMNFICQESPDFCININNDKVFIECTGAHLRRITQIKNVDYKIESTIDKKSKMPYCNNKTILFIDITNILAYYEINKIDYSYENIKSIVKDKLIQTCFSSCIIFNHLYNLKLNRYETTYSRIDNSIINDNVKLLLDTYWSFGNYRIQEHGTPYEG